MESRSLLPVHSYRHRDERIQADLNKLYDTHPTKSTSANRHHLPNVGDAYRQQQQQQQQPAAPKRDDEDEHRAPYFDLSVSGDVVAVLEKTAILNCRVKAIGNKTVEIKTDTYIWS